MNSQKMVLTDSAPLIRAQTDTMCNACQVSKLNFCLTEQKQILSPKHKAHTQLRTENRNAFLMLKRCTPLQFRTLRSSRTKTDNRSLSAEIQVGLLFKAKDLGLSEKDGVSA